MKLLKLILENFQGIRQFEFIPGGSNAAVHGDNATGKTTIGNALTWLLFDRPLDNSKNFSPKMKDSDGQDIHYIDTSVKGSFSLDDGQEITLERVYKEKWTKKRGSNTETLTGHSNEYYIDQVPIGTERAFTERVNRICPQDKAKILMNPLFFSAELSWQERRNILIEMFGDISDMDVIRFCPELSPLEELLLMPGSSGKLYSVDELLKISKANLKKTNEDIKTIPVRIDEANKSIPEVKGLTKTAVKARIQELKQEIAEHQKAISEIESGQGYDQQLALEKKSLSLELTKQRYAFETVENQKVCSNKARYEQGKKQVDDNRALINHKKECLSKAIKDLEDMQALFEKLDAEFDRIYQEKFDEASTICPTCGRALPADKITEIIQNWKQNKSTRLENINKRVQAECSKEIMVQKAEAVERIKADLEKGEKDQIEKDDWLNNFTFYTPADFEDTEEYRTILDQINSLEKQIDTGAVDTAPLKKPHLEAIQDLESQIQIQQDILSSIDISKKQKERIRALREQQKILTEEYDKNSKAVHLCERFIQEKVRMLSENINRFRNVRFKLFDQQINGGINEACEVMVNSREGLVPFNLANNAGRINAGIEIIDVMSEQWGLSMPIIVDNAESVTNLEPSHNQIIRLVVDESYPELFVDTGEQNINILDREVS